MNQQQTDVLHQSLENGNRTSEGIIIAYLLVEPVVNQAGNISDVRFLEANETAARLLGKSKEELIGRLRSETIGPFDENTTKLYRRVLRSNEPVFNEIYFPSMDKWIETSTYLRSPGRVVVIGHDITSRKNAEKILAEESNWLKYLNHAIERLWHINSLEAGYREIIKTAIFLMKANEGNILILDPEKDVLRMSSFVGHSQEFAMHFREVTIQTGSVCSIALKTRQQVVINDVQKDKRLESHFSIFRNAGIHAVQSTPIFNNDNTPIGIISTYSYDYDHFTKDNLKRMELYAHYCESFLEKMRNIQRMKNLNQELEQKVQARTLELTELLHNEKELNESKSRFVSYASHEFRTPLSTILTSTSLVQEYIKQGNPDKCDKHVSRIKNSIKNMMDILNDFLSLDKLSQGKTEVVNEKFNFREFAEEVVEEMNQLLKPGQKINLSYKGNKEINRDKKILKNILLNLLSNAIKYSENGKQIHFNIECNHAVSIKIKDEGMGIPEEEQNNMFEKYFRAKNVTNIQGTGLGLTLVKRYVELLEGKIEFSSKLNEGTTFHISMPIG